MTKGAVVESFNGIFVDSDSLKGEWTDKRKKKPSSFIW